MVVPLTILVSALGLAISEPSSGSQASTRPPQGPVASASMEAAIESILPAQSAQAKAAAQRLYLARFRPQPPIPSARDLKLSDGKLIEECKRFEPIEGAPKPKCDSVYIHHQHAYVVAMANKMSDARRYIIIAAYANHLAVGDMLKAAGFFESGPGQRLADAQPTIQADVDRITKALLMNFVLSGAP